MNKDAYAKLPQKAKETIDRYAGEPFSRRLGEGGDKATEDVKERWKALPGHTVSTLSPQESERWKKILEPVTTDWVKRTPDGEKVLAAFRAELTKIRAGK
jgi:TRAP-type C4-dicarboxylate transport system substrate-binding protein